MPTSANGEAAPSEGPLLPAIVRRLPETAVNELLMAMPHQLKRELLIQAFARLVIHHKEAEHGKDHRAAG